MHNKRIARVFPRKTRATPDDALAFFDVPPWDVPAVDEVHISVAFTYDRERAEALAYQWEGLGVPVKVDGPAYDNPAQEAFVPGRYVKPGYLMTSRGCNNNCWFCSVPKREGRIRELPIFEGHNILDSNLLQCSDGHIHAVFDMLAQQKERPLFTGGLEARRLQPWHCERLRQIGTKRAYFAYDTPDDLEPLIAAGKMLIEAGFTRKSHALCCYCLIGYRGDTFERAEQRLMQAIRAGFMPYAMLYRDEQGTTDQKWRDFQTQWLKPEWVNRVSKSIWEEMEP